MLNIPFSLQDNKPQNNESFIALYGILLKMIQITKNFSKLNVYT